MYKTEASNEHGFYAKVVEHSNCDGTEIYTLELRYPRFIHAEFMTHRMFSRNASSSRAIPVAKMLKDIEEQPAMPIHWGANQPGMQAKSVCSEAVYSVFSGDFVWNKVAWQEAAIYAREYASAFDIAGYHKQIVNRLTEPFQFITVVVTATEWENFFNLRLHPDAQPEIQELARLMKQAMEASEPRMLEIGEWHLPYVDEGDLSDSEALKCSAARCARVSYKNHDKSDPDVAKDIELADMLLSAGHMSPFEHQASPMPYDAIQMNDEGIAFKGGVTHLDRTGAGWSGNFKDWVQYRQVI